MRGLGEVEVSSADTSFQTESQKPALPGTKDTFVESTSRWRRPKDTALLDVRMQSCLDLSLRTAQSQVRSTRSSTTMAALAQVLEATGAHEDAIRTAKEAIDLCRRSSSDQLIDPIAARLSLEVLIRLDRLDDAVSRARDLPVDPFANRMIAAALAAEGHFEDAHEFINRVQGITRDAVLAFLHISEGNYAGAVPLLRAALRRSPDDADSAHNLSIAFWMLGSRRKARAAALQATRSAPGRADISLHYLELLLADGDFAHGDKEVDSLLKRGVDPNARLLIVQARARLGMNDFPMAEKLLSRAGELARQEDEPATVAEVLSNLSRLRFVHGKLSRDEALTQLSKLHVDHPSSYVVVANLAQISNHKHHAKALKDAFEDVSEHMPAARKAFVEYQLATLEGQNEWAAERALRWLELEPQSSHAVSAAMVALGIGMERWAEAADIAQGVIDSRNPDPAQLNNAAYILAMAGMADRAVELLEPYSDEGFVLKATLGLAYLASGQVDRGMKMYRQAAEEADSDGDGTRSLMTAYQALVVRQLDLLDSNETTMMSAISLPPVELPDDWEDRPEFLRLHHVALIRQYGWPLAI